MVDGGTEASRDRAARAGRTASWFYLGVAVFTAITTLLPSQVKENIAVLMSVAAACLVIGAVARVVPWERLHPRSPLLLAVVAFALIAVADSAGGVSHYTYATYFVVVFVWAGLTQPPRTSFWLAPLALAAYLLPPLLGFSHGGDAMSSAEVAIPACILVGEVVARMAASDGEAREALARALEEQRELSWRDPLTGLYNRRAFVELGTALIAGVLRRGQVPAVLFLDLDGLKHINDTWGHETGDALLVEAARLLQGSATEGSISCRLGGDEFCLLSETEDQARQAMERLGAAIAALPQHISGATLSLSIGIGIGAAGQAGPSTGPGIDGPGTAGPSIDDMLNSADRDMLAHKRGRGRDRSAAGQ
ncbi:MAG: GGDEF domain-containing protein [Acidimicrobiales bacterium]